MRPQAAVTELPEVGDYPQIEMPERLAEVISGNGVDAAENQLCVRRHAAK